MQKLEKLQSKGKISIVGASQVKHIIAKTISSRSKIFKLEPENISFTAKIPLPVKLRYKEITSSTQ